MTGLWWITFFFEERTYAMKIQIFLLMLVWPVRADVLKMRRMNLIPVAGGPTSMMRYPVQYAGQQMTFGRRSPVILAEQIPHRTRGSLQHKLAMCVKWYTFSPFIVSLSDIISILQWEFNWHYWLPFCHFMFFRAQMNCWIFLYH